MTTYGEVWTTLSAINVNEHTEKKNGLTYLSWAWAWATLMREYPEATYSFGDNEVLSDDTVITHCTINIGELERSMWLAVMSGYKNAPVENPSATQVANTRMRCLTKCMAMFGLGHYIYAGEDLPEDDEPKTKAKAKPKPKPIEEKTQALQQGIFEDFEKSLANMVEGDGDWDEKFCTDVCELVINIAKLTPLEGLKSLHVENKANLDKIKELYPNVYDAYVEELKSIRATKQEEGK